MKAFHTIAIPHDDILEGRLTMDVFAADLWELFNGRGAEEYKDAEIFFQKTYVTEGLENLLDVVGKRVRGEGGDPVIQIQTPFGGGKTHALIAIYHKAREWGVKPVVIVGTPLSAKETLWGLLEEQLTGKRRDFDELFSNGRDQLRALLEQHQPMLILMDELLDYVTKAAAVRVEDSTLAAQSMEFMKELTEAVGTLERVSLLITLPSSLLEHFDERAEQLFQQMQRVSGRVEKIYTPVEEHEIAHVVRSRLFADIDEGMAGEIIDGFVEYARREGLLPQGVEPSEYRKRFEASYPFQPEVIDALYHRWGSFSTFQRTRGVLRLLALVVYALKDQTLPYVSLADFDLADQEIRRELLKHIGPEFDSVIAADITGPEAGAKKISGGLGKAYQGLRLGERVARSIFMYSFSGGPERGANLLDVKRTGAVLETPAAVISEAVDALKTQLFYIQAEGGRYFFTNQPNLNRLMVTRIENIEETQQTDLELELLKSRISGAGLKVFPPWPDEPSEIPDTRDLKLVIFREADQTLLQRFLEEKGEKPRVHRNTLFFLAPNESERPAFDQLARRFLAYRELGSDPSIGLTDEQREEVKQGIKRSKSDLNDSLRRMYRMVYVPAKDGLKLIDLGIPTFGENRGLDQEVYDRLRSEGEILEKLAPSVIRERYLHDRDWVSTEQLYQASLTTSGEMRVASAEAWQESISEGVRLGIFGLGELEAEKPYCRYFKEQPSVDLNESEVIIREALCQDREDSEPEDTTDVGQEDETDTGIQPDAKTGFSLRFGVPQGQVASLMGLLNFLQSRFKRMDITLSVEDGDISDQDYEDKVKETFRQMGVEVTEGE